MRRGRVPGTGLAGSTTSEFTYSVLGKVLGKHSVPVLPEVLHGTTVRRPVPPTGLAAKQMVGRHPVARGQHPPPASGNVRRARVPRLAISLGTFFQRATARRWARTHGQPAGPMFRPDAMRLRSRGLVSALSTSGQVIAGPYYWIAGQVYVAGAVAGDVEVE